MKGNPRTAAARGRKNKEQNPLMESTIPENMQTDVPMVPAHGKYLFMTVNIHFFFREPRTQGDLVGNPSGQRHSKKGDYKYSQAITARVKTYQGRELERN